MLIVVVVDDAVVIAVLTVVIVVVVFIYIVFIVISSSFLVFVTFLHKLQHSPCTMAWNQASKKYSRALSLGTLHILAAGTVAKVRNRLALIPGGGSKTNTRPDRIKFVGILGMISMAKNRRNPA